MTKKKDDAHHYFASCVVGWATAETEDAALLKLLRSISSEARTCIKNRGSMYVWTCRVPLPEDAEYQINRYMPDQVKGISERMHHEITKFTQKDVRVLTYEGSCDDRRLV